MGGGHSRELELAQQQVARLTKDLKKVSTELVFKESALAAAIKKAPVPQADEQLKRQLAAAEAEAANYKQMTRDAPFLREQLQRAQRSGDEKLQGAQSELLAAKRELERVTGELKFAHQEQRTLGRLQADLSTAQRELSAEHDRAERLSAKLVAEANAALLDENAAAEGSAHPVFGELLHDFGHKRLYRASPLTLWTGTVLWDSQRAFRQERAELIAKSKTRSTVGGWPGVISAVMANTGPDGHANGNHNGVAPHTNGVHNDGMAPPHGLAAIVDGQHRLGAAHVLDQRGDLHDGLAQILVEVYPPMGDASVRELFTEINKSEPVTLIDLPEDFGGASRDENQLLTAAAETLKARYPAMFKASQACRAPHLNVDTLRNELLDAGVVSRHGMRSAEELLEWLEARNEALGARSDAAWEEARKTAVCRAKTAGALETALAKSSEHAFYLGLTQEWLNDDELFNAKAA